MLQHWHRLCFMTIRHIVDSICLVDWRVRMHWGFARCCRTDKRTCTTWCHICMLNHRVNVMKYAVSLMTENSSLFTFYYCTPGNFRQEFNSVAFVKAIFDLIKFLTKFFHETTSVGSEIFKNAKINNKQQSDLRASDRRLTKINSWRTAWRSLVTKFFADENFLLYSKWFIHTQQ